MTAAANQLLLNFNAPTPTGLRASLGVWRFNPVDLRQRLLNSQSAAELDGRWTEVCLTTEHWPVGEVLELQQTYTAARTALEAA